MHASLINSDQTSLPIELIQSLFIQKDIDALIIALNTTIASQLLASENIRVTLLIWEEGFEQLCLYSFDKQTNKVHHQSMRANIHCLSKIDWKKRTCYEQTTEQFYQQHPGLIRLQVYQQLKEYQLYPLIHDGVYLGGIEFISSDEGTHLSSTSRLAEQITLLCGFLISNLLERTTLISNNQSLLHAYQQSQILVDVTNSIIASLDLDHVIIEISKEIHRFFAINYVEVALLDNDHPHLNIYTALYQSTQDIKLEKIIEPIKDSLSELVIKQQKMLIVDLNEANQNHSLAPRLTMLLAKGNHPICLIPLVFGEKILGVFKLAQSSSKNTFSTENIRLLKQIAARIAISIANALAYRQISHLKEKLLQENLHLSEKINHIVNFSEIIGQSEAIRNVLEKIELVAQSDCNVLILGETGTGKELVAQAIHNLSHRKNQRMVKINCAAIPSGLLESDLFGHEKGAYTGANSTRMGRFEQANKSSLFLDEVGDIPLELQPKLLRALQEREIERLGSNKIISVDVRVIAATNRDLSSMVEKREYRSDLFYRLNVFPIFIPPLRERREDIPLLAAFFTQKYAKRMKKSIDSISTDTLQLLQQLPLPGNVRELQNIIERAVILNKNSTLVIHHDDIYDNVFMSHPATRPEPPKPLTEGIASSLASTDKEAIIAAIKACNGIIAGPRGAAEKLGIKRTTLLSRMQRLGINPKALGVS